MQSSCNCFPHLNCEPTYYSRSSFPSRLIIADNCLPQESGRQRERQENNNFPMFTLRKRPLGISILSWMRVFHKLHPQSGCLELEEVLETTMVVSKSLHMIISIGHSEPSQSALHCLFEKSLLSIISNPKGLLSKLVFFYLLAGKKKLKMEAKDPPPPSSQDCEVGLQMPKLYFFI